MLTVADVCIHTHIRSLSERCFGCLHAAWPVGRVIKIWPVERTARGDNTKCSQAVCLLQATLKGQRAGMERGDGVLPV